MAQILRDQNYQNSLVDSENDVYYEDGIPQSSFASKPISFTDTIGSINKKANLAKSTIDKRMNIGQTSAQPQFKKAILESYTDADSPQFVGVTGGVGGYDRRLNKQYDRTGQLTGDRSQGFDAYEVYHPGQESADYLASPSGESKMLRQRMQLAKERNVPYETITNEDVFERGAEQTLQGYYDVTKEKGMPENTDLGPLDYYRNNQLILGDRENPLNNEVLRADSGQKGYFGRPLTQVANPNTLENVTAASHNPIDDTNFAANEKRNNKNLSRLEKLNLLNGDSMNVDSDGKFLEMIDIGQSGIAKLGSDTLNMVKNVIGQDNIDAYDKWASGVEKKFGGDGKVGIVVDEKGDFIEGNVLGAKGNLFDWRDREKADKEFGVKKSSRVRQQQLNESASANIEAGNYVDASVDIFNNMLAMLGDSVGEMATLAIPYAGLPLLVATRTSNGAEEFERNNKRPPTLEELSKMVGGATIALGYEKLLIKSGFTNAIKSVTTKAGRAKPILNTLGSGVGEGIQEGFDSSQEEYTTQKVGSKSAMEILTSPETRLAIASGAGMGTTLAGGSQIPGAALNVAASSAKKRQKKRLDGIAAKLQEKVDKIASSAPGTKYKVNNKAIEENNLTFVPDEEGSQSGMLVLTDSDGNQRNIVDVEQYSGGYILDKDVYLEDVENTEQAIKRINTINKLTGGEVFEEDAAYKSSKDVGNIQETTEPTVETNPELFGEGPIDPSVIENNNMKETISVFDELGADATSETQDVISASSEIINQAEIVANDIESTYDMNNEEEVLESKVVMEHVEKQALHAVNQASESLKNRYTDTELKEILGEAEFNSLFGSTNLNSAPNTGKISPLQRAKARLEALKAAESKMVAKKGKRTPSQKPLDKVSAKASQETSADKKKSETVDDGLYTQRQKNAFNKGIEDKKTLSAKEAALKHKGMSKEDAAAYRAGYASGVKNTENKKEKQEFITRQDLKDNPNKAYIFGDNLVKKGLGGQAKEMRGEPNAYGIPTKKLPSMSKDAFFTDVEYKENVKAINAAIENIPNGIEIVIPAAGIGTGLASLEKTAPRTFKYLQFKIKELSERVVAKPLTAKQRLDEIRKSKKNITVIPTTKIVSDTSKIIEQSDSKSIVIDNINNNIESMLETSFGNRDPWLDVKFDYQELPDNEKTKSTLDELTEPLNVDNIKRIVNTLHKRPSISNKYSKKELYSMISDVASFAVDFNSEINNLLPDTSTKGKLNTALRTSSEYNIPASMLVYFSDMTDGKAGRIPREITDRLLIATIVGLELDEQLNIAISEQEVADGIFRGDNDLNYVGIIETAQEGSYTSNLSRSIGSSTLASLGIKASGSIRSKGISIEPSMEMAQKLNSSLGLAGLNAITKIKDVNGNNIAILNKVKEDGKNINKIKLVKHNNKPLIPGEKVPVSEMTIPQKSMALSQSLNIMNIIKPVLEYDRGTKQYWTEVQNSDLKPDSKQKKAHEKFENFKWKRDDDFYSFLEDEVGEKNILKVMGWKDPATAQASRRDSVEAKNDTLLREYRDSRDFLEDIRDMEFTFQTFVGESGRMYIKQTVLNPISGKQYSRNIIQSSKKTEVTAKNLPVFKRAILQALDIKVEKTMDKKLEEEWNKLPEKLNNLSTEEMVNLAAKEEGIASLKAIYEYKKYIKNPKGYKTGVRLETDGLTNGFAIGLLNFIGDLKTWEEFRKPTGFFYDSDKDDSVARYASEGGLDSYQIISGKLETALNKLPKNSIGKKLIDLYGSKVFGRNLAKNPLMTYMYGVGQFTLEENIGNYLYDDMFHSGILSMIESGDPKKLANARTILKMADIKADENLMEQEFTPNQIKLLTDMFTENIGSVVFESLESSLGGLVRVRNIVQDFNIYAAGIDAIYTGNKDVDDYLKSIGTKNKKRKALKNAHNPVVEAVNSKNSTEGYTIVKKATVDSEEQLASVGDLRSLGAGKASVASGIKFERFEKFFMSDGSSKSKASVGGVQRQDADLIVAMINGETTDVIQVFDGILATLDDSNTAEDDYNQALMDFANKYNMLEEFVKTAENIKSKALDDKKFYSEIIKAIDDGSFVSPRNNSIEKLNAAIDSIDFILSGDNRSDKAIMKNPGAKKNFNKTITQLKFLLAGNLEMRNEVYPKITKINQMAGGKEASTKINNSFKTSSKINTTEPVTNWKYAKNGYEVSSKGDKRFSAFNAKLKDGRTIEEAYQLDVKGFREADEEFGLPNTTFSERKSILARGKGKKPVNKLTIEESYEQYLDLWKQWAIENPSLVQELKNKSKGKQLTDLFANTPINQARALTEILNELEPDIVTTTKKATTKKATVKPSILDGLYDEGLLFDNTENKISTTPEFDKLPSYKKGQKTMTYAGIGSRATPVKTQSDMTEVAKILNKAGYTLNSGGAVGADKAFEKGSGQNKNIYYAKNATDITRDIAREIHPNPNALSDYPLKLMARNTNQLFGSNLDTPVDFVLAYTEDGATSTADRTQKTGGTGQAIDMASRKGVPVINMANPGWKQELEAIVGKQETKSKPEPITVAGDLEIRSPGDFEWNKQQKEAVVSVVDWFKQQSNSFYSLQGKAGTGKTALVQEAIRQFRILNPKASVIVMATSHEAKQVIRASMKDADLGYGDTVFSTIASAIGARPNRFGEFGRPEDADAKIQGKQLIIVDESSMLSDKTMQEISEASDAGSRIIYLGDRGQLPPIGVSAKEIQDRGSKYSGTFDSIYSSLLTERMRQGEDSPILTFVDMFWEAGQNGLKLNDGVKIRKNSPLARAAASIGLNETSGNNVERINSTNETGAILFTNGSNMNTKLEKSILDAFDNQVKNNRWHDVMELTYTNFSVAKAVSRIKNHLRKTGAIKKTTSFLDINDQVMFLGNTIVEYGDDKFSLYNSSRATVISARKSDKVVYAKSFGRNNVVVDFEVKFDIASIQVANSEVVVDGFVISSIKEGGKEVQLDPGSISRAYNAISSIPDNQKRASRKLSKADYQKYFDIKHGIFPLFPSYAGTTHKAQGSGYEVLVVDEANMATTKSRDNNDYNELMYTAGTRARNIAIFRGRGADNGDASNVDVNMLNESYKNNEYVDQGINTNSKKDKAIEPGTPDIFKEMNQYMKDADAEQSGLYISLKNIVRETIRDIKFVKDGKGSFHSNGRINIDTESNNVSNKHEIVNHELIHTATSLGVDNMSDDSIQVLMGLLLDMKKNGIVDFINKGHQPEWIKSGLAHIFINTNTGQDHSNPKEMIKEMLAVLTSKQENRIAFFKLVKDFNTEQGRSSFETVMKNLEIFLRSLMAELAKITGLGADIMNQDIASKKIDVNSPEYKLYISVLNDSIAGIDGSGGFDGSIPFEQNAPYYGPNGKVRSDILPGSQTPNTVRTLSDAVYNTVSLADIWLIETIDEDLSNSNSYIGKGKVIAKKAFNDALKYSPAFKSTIDFINENVIDTNLYQQIMLDWKIKKKVDYETINKYLTASQEIQNKATTHMRNLFNEFDRKFKDLTSEERAKLSSGLMRSDIAIMFDGAEREAEIQSVIDEPSKLDDLIDSYADKLIAYDIDFDNMNNYLEASVDFTVNGNPTVNTFTNAMLMAKVLNEGKSNDINSLADDLDVYWTLRHLQVSKALPVMKKIGYQQVYDTAAYATASKVMADALFVDQENKRLKGYFAQSYSNPVEIIFVSKSDISKFEMKNDGWTKAKDVATGSIYKRIDLSGRFRAGVFNETSREAKGTIVDGRADNLTFEKAEELYGKDIMPIRDDSGNIVTYRWHMNFADRVEIMGMDEDIAKVLANTSSSTLRKAQGAKMNIDFIQSMSAGIKDSAGAPMYSEEEIKDKKLTDATKKKLREQIKEGNFAMIYEPDGIDLYTELGADTFKDFELMPEGTALPYEIVTENIKYIRKGMSDQLIGYKEDFFFNKREIVMIEHMWKGFVSEMKQNVVIKSGIVHIGNFMSNIYILRSMGVPVFSIYQNYKIGLSEIPKMRKRRQKITDLEIKLSGIVAMGGSQKMIKILETRLNDLKSEVESNPVNDLFEQGLVQSITDEILVEELMGSDVFRNKMAELFSSLKDKESNPTLTKMLKAFGVAATDFASMTKREKQNIIYDTTNETISKVGASMENDPSVMNILKELYGAQNSSTGTAMAQVMQMSDYLSRYALYKHMIDVGASKEEATELALDSFVDYRKNLPSVIRTLSDYGFWPFATFSLRIQPLLYKLATEHPLRTLMTTVMFSELEAAADISFTGWNVFNSNLHSGLVYGTDLTPIEMASFVPKYYADAYGSL